MFIALASHWLRCGFEATSQLLYTGNAGVVADHAGFTLSSSWLCVHCASFTLAALCVRTGFAVGILLGKSAQVEPRALLRASCARAS